jgi:hypothetical protein
MAKKNTENSISCADAGRNGGLATLARYGVNHFRNAGIKGQMALSERYSTKDRSTWGKKGGRPKKQELLGGKLNKTEDGSPPD